MGPALKNGAGGGGGDGDDVDNDGNNSLNFPSAEKGPNTVLGALHATCHLHLTDIPFLYIRKLRYKYFR